MEFYLPNAFSLGSCFTCSIETNRRPVYCTALSRREPRCWNGAVWGLLQHPNSTSILELLGMLLGRLVNTFEMKTNDSFSLCLLQYLL